MSWSNISSEEKLQIKTLGALKAKGYESKSIQEELRDNLIHSLRNKINVFADIHGYDETVIPDLQRAILSRHHINLLGLRGQAKTRLARMMVKLLDEYVPVIKGSELNDDPLQPLSYFGKHLVDTEGDNTPITWLNRNDRFTEKLATPDVSIADLIGDVDPIKAANLNLSYSDERVLHYGLIPRSHRCIFVINELPDLQARIQVALFNILQEGDIQIRGFKMRFPLDLQFIFTANPEDYTNRGSIVTPLKDRIDSQILTHYPDSIEIAKTITRQEVRIKPIQEKRVETNELARDLVEQIAFEARESEYIDEKSGVSARLTISAYENLISAAERRSLINGDDTTAVRIGDFWGIVPAIAGKVELVYEGEQEGAGIVAQNLIAQAIRKQFTLYFPDPEKEKKRETNIYANILAWFEKGNHVDFLNELPTAEYKFLLKEVDGLEEMINGRYPESPESFKYFLMEFCLHGLAAYSMLSKKILSNMTTFSDFMSGMFNMDDSFGMEDEE